MKKVARRLVFVLFFVAIAQFTVGYPLSVSAATQPIYKYTKTFDTTNGFAFEDSVTTDYQNNVYVVGYFSGTVVFDGPGGSDVRTSLGDGSSYLTRYDANGNYAWTRVVDDTNGASTSNYVTTDSSGNIYVVGNYVRTVAFDGVGGTDAYTNGNGVNNPFITKYDKDGVYQWTNVIDSTSEARSDSIAIDADGAVYIDGYFSGTATFDGTGGSDIRATVDHNSFLTKYNNDGSYEWTKTIDDTNGTTTNGGAYGYGVVIDKSGNIYTTGYFYNTVIFDGVGGSDIKSSINYDNSFLTKYDHNGDYISTKTFDSSQGNMRVSRMVIDSNDNIYIKGIFYNTVTFDVEGGTDRLTSATNSDFITKFKADGSYSWTRTIDSSNGISNVYFMITDNESNLYLVGDFYDTVVFDGPGGIDIKTGLNPVDNTFFTKIDSSGNYAWTETFDNSNGWSYGNGVSVDGDGNIYIVGYFSGTVVFDVVGGTDSLTSTPSGSSHLTKFQTRLPIPPVPTIPPAPTVPPKIKTVYLDQGTHFSVYKENTVSVSDAIVSVASVASQDDKTNVISDSSQLSPTEETPQSTGNNWWYLSLGVLGFGVVAVVIYSINKFIKKHS